jgi:hypothetical protein
MLIVVRTYPDPSRRYDETVCTAAITDAGEWRRLYPVPLRYLEAEKQYRTWSVVRVDVEPVSGDNRSESRRPRLDSLVQDNRLTGEAARREWVAASPTFASVDELVQAGRSIGPVAVRSVEEFIAEPASAEWGPKEKAILQQDNLFQAKRELEKIPVKFRLRWKDGEGNEQTNTFRSWEICQTWRSWRDQYGEDEVIGRMRDQWMNNVLRPGRDILFFMGNLAQPKLRGVFHITGTYATTKGSTDSNGGLFP